MNRNKLISILTMCTLSTQALVAEDFNQFLKQAIEKSPYLQSSKIEVEQAQKLASKQIRYTNPSLEVGYSQYKPEDANTKNGYSISLSKDIQLWSTIQDNESVSNNILNNANNTYSQNRAAFIRDISLYYTTYAQEKKFLQLGEKSLDIAKTINDISKKRYKVGSISRSDILQSKVAYLNVVAQNKELELNSMESYYDLLQFSGIDNEINIDIMHNFKFKPLDTISQNPELLSILSQQELIQSQANLDSNSIESVTLNGSYSQEPDQTVSGVSLSIPLVLFNNKNEEKSIARLEKKKSTLLALKKKTSLKNEMSKLLEKRNYLLDLKMKYNNIISLNNTLLEMYFEKYRISKATILEIQDIQNKVIETTKNLIKTETALNQNAIYLDYIQGGYNEKNITN